MVSPWQFKLGKTESSKKPLSKLHPWNLFRPRESPQQKKQVASVEVAIGSLLLNYANKKKQAAALLSSHIFPSFYLSARSFQLPNRQQQKR